MVRPRIVGIIPARMASSRFPGKPMELIHGMPMIGHCYFRTSMCSELDEVVVATCDEEISRFIESIGGSAIMTSPSHERASDRTAEAMLKIEEWSGKRVDIVVMVQGDEPMDTPKMISSAIAPMLNDPDLNVVNLMGKIRSIAEFDDPNTVKVVTGQDGNALYFSREPIPSRKKGVFSTDLSKQICIIPFRRDYLLEFNQHPQTPLEKVESVDMLRVLEKGDNVKMVAVDEDSVGVDTPEDLEAVVELMKKDKLMRSYL